MIVGLRGQLWKRSAIHPECNSDTGRRTAIDHVGLKGEVAVVARVRGVPDGGGALGGHLTAEWTLVRLAQRRTEGRAHGLQLTIGESRAEVLGKAARRVDAIHVVEARGVPRVDTPLYKET